MTSARRRRQWSDRFIDFNGVFTEVDEQLLINPGDTEIGKGSTLVRMIIDLSASSFPPLNSTSVETMEVNLGVGMVSSEVVEGSINVGLEGEIPLSGWLWRRRFMINGNNIGPVPQLPLVDIRA